MTKEQLDPEIINRLAMGDNAAMRIAELLSHGSIADLNEHAKWIIAQEAFKTTDPDTIAMKAKALILAKRSECTIIRGESGTGKELLAQILHGTRKGNFVAVNMTAVTDTLFESELFGHVKGAFTGATENRAGLISYANNGTLFFDEIGDMPVTLQPKLLRVIQTRKYRVVGSNTEQPVTCRIIAATHANMEELIAAGKFRRDLYYRLATFDLTVKPLRERRDDVRFFTSDPALLEKLAEHPFNGNIRELESIAKRWEVFSTL